MKTPTIFLLLLIIISFTSAHAMDENMFTKSHSIYMKGIDGSESDLEKSIKYFGKLSETAPYDIFINVYRGSLQSRMAQHVFMPWNQMKHVDAGVELMDDALDEISGIHETQSLGGTALSFRMKLIVAHTYSRFPRFLNRYQDAKDLVSDLLESSQLNSANKESKNSLYNLAAEMAKEDGDEKKQAELLSKIL